MYFLMPSASIVAIVPFTGASRRGRQGLMTKDIHIKVIDLELLVLNCYLLQLQ